MQKSASAATVLFLAIMDFKFDNSHSDHFIHDVRLMEIHTNQEFYNKIGYIFIEMPKFKKTENQLENELDEWLFILNNLRKLDEIPVSLKGNDVYERVFEIAKVGNLTPEEMNEYQQSLKIQRDNNSALNYAKKEGIEVGKAEGLELGKAEGLELGKAEGLELGKAEGIEVGEHKKAIEMAIKLKAKNIAVEEVSELTGLSHHEIEAL